MFFGKRKIPEQSLRLDLHDLPYLLLRDRASVDLEAPENGIKKLSPGLLDIGRLREVVREDSKLKGNGRNLRASKDLDASHLILEGKKAGGVHRWDRMHALLKKIKHPRWILKDDARHLLIDYCRLRLHFHACRHHGHLGVMEHAKRLAVDEIDAVCGAYDLQGFLLEGRGLINLESPFANELQHLKRLELEPPCLKRVAHHLVIDRLGN